MNRNRSARARAMDQFKRKKKKQHPTHANKKSLQQFRQLQRNNANNRSNIVYRKNITQGMAKQAVLGALEDVIGEYVVNLDKENLKFQALRGRIRMENVQLDGDFIGGRILGSIGLSGFGILSCWAKSINITVPLKNMEKEPTRIEIKGVHLLCLPLLPSTANKMYGAGTSKDPTCTLRTRVKRSKLARYEKFFRTGRISGEGPVARRILIAARNVEKDQKRKSKKRQSTESAESDAFFNYLVSDLEKEKEPEQSTTNVASEENSVNLDTDLYDLPRDWKVKLREKILRNLELAMFDIHVRCEVSEGGLEFGVQTNSIPNRAQRTNSDHRGLNYDQRAFAFGATLDKLRIRTANENWIVGSHEKDKRNINDDHLGDHPYDVRNNKLFGFENFCMYWDDDPPFLLSETDIIKSPEKKMSADSFHMKIGNAMAALVTSQDPGRKVYESLLAKKRSSQVKHVNQPRPHQYCFQHFNYEVKQRLSDRTQPGSISCEAEFLPFQWDWKLRPSQLVQYRKLKSAMLSQRRFDTMLRQKPSQSPEENPLEWWRYAYGCITSRPNSRPWEDVLRIVRSRDEYLELVLKKLSKGNGGSGYHAGLTESESSRLLELEELLPIEALMAFHLIALRQFFDPDQDDHYGVEKSGARGRGRTKIRKKLSRMFRSRSKSSRQLQETSGQPEEVPISQKPTTPLIPPKTPDSISTSILEAMKLRLGRKRWKTRLRFLQPGLTISLLTESNDEIVKLVTEGAGEVKLLGQGHQDIYFDISKFELFDCREQNGQSDRLLFVQASGNDIPDENWDSRSEASDTAIVAVPSATSFMELPPNGVVCRFAAMRSKAAKRISLSAHPATLIWTTRCFDALAEFFGAPTSKMKTELTRHLKNVSTPLARKAQLAFLSQSDFQFFFNVAAPKIWVPFSSDMSDGSLLFDAGNFRLVCSKDDGKMGTDWDLDASDIQIKYARCHVSEVQQRILSSLLDHTSREMVPIIRPFQVNAVSGMKDAKDIASSFLIEHNAYMGSAVNLDIAISPICLNLVDAEVLARAIGKWYSQGIVAVRGRALSRDEGTPARDDPGTHSKKRKEKHISESRHSPPHCLSLTIEKIEMALEGHSKIHISDERSLGSYDTALLGDATSHVRTYVVELFQISARRSRHNQVAATELLINDASVIQVRNSSEYTPLADRHVAFEDQYCILERRKVGSPSNVNHKSAPAIHDGIAPKVLKPHQILKVSLFHDRRTHLDEVEIDIESVVLRVTPTSLKDCAKGLRKIVELVQLMTKEMERNVHEQGRKARQRGNNDPEDRQTKASRPVSPTLSVTSDLTNPHSDMNMSGTQKDYDDSVLKSPSDSSLLFKVTIRDGMMLAGRPTSSEVSNLRVSGSSRRSYAFAVVHVSSNALIMFQSIENHDASGNTTVHASLDNLSISVTTAFDSASASISSPMVGPTGAELRIMNATENQGCVVSRELSLDCEHLKSALTTNDLRILVNIVKTMMNRLQGETDGLHSTRDRMPRKEDSGVTTLIKYQKRGTGIATSIRVEFQTFSFVVLRAYRSKYGAPEFLSFNLKELKAKLDGCISALTGECNAGISIDYFNSEVGVWDHAVEPFPIAVHVDQMPNELILDATTPKPVQLNLTGIFLRDVAELSIESFNTRETTEMPNVLTPSALSTVGLRRATESHTVSIHNFTGMDVEVHPMSPSSFNSSCQSSVRFDTIGLGLIKDSCCVSIESIVDVAHFQNSVDEAMEALKLSLQVPSKSVVSIGEREILSNLPVSSSLDHSVSLHLLRPKDAAGGDTDAQRTGSSPEIVQAAMTNSSREYVNYHAEPVVEWCMENQRLRSSTVDLYSLRKGRDLLSASIWSPEEDYNEDTLVHLQSQDPEALNDHQVGSPSRKGKTHTGHKSEWLRPYLKNDSPEWTDMTCILRMARERVMLPDSNWIWVNNWSVDVNGAYGESTDADGWEYQADFETFTRARRFYQRGDSCRRRRWTRTRIIKPPKLDDPQRQLKLVWETSRDARGNYKVEVKSHITVHNSTGSKLSLFVSSPTWNEEKYAGSMEAAGKAHIPIALSSALYLHLAKSRSGRSSGSISDYASADKVMMLPTGYNSNVLVRTCMELGDVSETNLHFLLQIECKRGIVDIYVEPVLRVVNLLPCHLECQLGELLRPSERRQADSRPSLPLGMKKRVANVETLSIASGKEGKCSALNPSAKPHLSLRVPGYKWSCWQRIVNRKASSCTWRPDESEEDLYFNFDNGDVEKGDEFRMTVRFDRLGDAYRDPLVLIVAVECGHSPTIRVYAQYWIVDKTGFGCHFCESGTNVMGTSPEIECSRRSHLLKEDSRIPAIKRDMNIPGHQWSIGMSGMSLYFSRQEKIALSIESGAGDRSSLNIAEKSKWTAPLDVSNVMPKAVLSVDENGGSRRFELAIGVSMCDGVFLRTKLITVIPRYQIVNLLKRDIVLAQDGCLKKPIVIPSQASVPYHWERQSLPPKVRLGAPNAEQKDSKIFSSCWANGCIQLDKIGITSMRLPTSTILPTKPMVVQAEVRLATKDQSSAVVIVLWSTNEKSNPLYVLRNTTTHTIICRQPLQAEESKGTANDLAIVPTIDGLGRPSIECGAEFSPIVRSMLGLDRLEEFVWILKGGEVTCFGFDDPEKPHILEWACVDDDNPFFHGTLRKAIVEVDAMGSTSSLGVGDGREIRCQIGAELSTKVIEFSVEESPENHSSSSLDPNAKNVNNESPFDIEDDEHPSFSFRFNVPIMCASFIDNLDPSQYGREILMASFENLYLAFSQSREGYHEMELQLMSLQVDNHVPSSIHPVLLFCPKNDDKEPFLHTSAVRRMQQSYTYVFRYAACRMLEVHIFLDRRTAETIARYIEPVTQAENIVAGKTGNWVSDLTNGMATKYSYPDTRAPREVELLTRTANSGRIYFEQLHLHPVRISLTFTQEWVESSETESMMVFQFIRGMASIADAPLTFTSFVVAHVFESPQTLVRVIATHYSSQLTKQIFTILGSLAILGVPADFISNVGTGVRDFFYEPIQGAVHGPRQFIEGLEVGTQSLARGVFVGVVRGAANVTDVINSNLAGLTADDDFIDERKAHQRMLADAMSRGVASRTFYNSLFLAGASIARGVKSGAYGIVDQPTRYASKFGPVGFMKGVGKAMVGVLVKPVVGVGDAATLLMNHVSDATSNKQIHHKIPKRLRRALPSTNSQKPNCVSLQPYDDRAAKAQKIVTGGDSVDDVYIGHVNIPTHLIIGSDQCLWAIDRGSREPWCVAWEEISHFGATDMGMRIAVFSQTGLKTFLFHTEDEEETEDLHRLLAMQLQKTGNSSSNLAELRPSSGDDELDIMLTKIPGVKSQQSRHVFGSCNARKKRLPSGVKDEIDLIEQCFERIKRLGSTAHRYFATIDEEAWNLVSCWGQVFSGLSSRRCIAASVINGTGGNIQIKSTKLVEGGSPCYSLPTQEFDPDQGVLRAGGVILFFGWGVVPSLLQPGNVFMHIETNGFIADLADQKSRDTSAEATSGYRIGFLEKSYDDAGWWAKYWLILLRDDDGT